MSGRVLSTADSIAAKIKGVCCQREPENTLEIAAGVRHVHDQRGTSASEAARLANRISGPQIVSNAVPKGGAERPQSDAECLERFAAGRVQRVYGVGAMECVAQHRRASRAEWCA